MHKNSWMVKWEKLFCDSICRQLVSVWSFERPYPFHSAVTSIPHSFRSATAKMIFGSFKLPFSAEYQSKKPQEANLHNNNSVFTAFFGTPVYTLSNFSSTLLTAGTVAQMCLLSFSFLTCLCNVITINSWYIV